MRQRDCIAGRCAQPAAVPHRCLVCVCLLAVLASLGCAQQRVQKPQQLGYDELVAQSDLVLIGRVGRVKDVGQTVRVPGGAELVVQHVRIDVLQVLKGAAGDAVYLRSYALPEQPLPEDFDPALLAHLRGGDPRDYLFFLVGGLDDSYYRFTQDAPVTGYSLRVLERPVGLTPPPTP